MSKKARKTIAEKKRMHPIVIGHYRHGPERRLHGIHLHASVIFHGWYTSTVTVAVHELMCNRPATRQELLMHGWCPKACHAILAQEHYTTNREGAKICILCPII